MEHHVMSDNSYRALVVDDESIVRKMTIHALEREGFLCDAADSGFAAEHMAESNRYDVVVTDLRMPNGHGHALATELLALENPPLVMVVTSMAEPRLVKDLIGCGVDSIDFKPLHQELYAAKVKAMVDRHRGIRINYLERLISWKLSR
jgi:DNA-binding response OmpR family regulator